MKHLTIAAALAVTLVPVVAVAQSANDDVRCLLLSSTFAGSAKDARAQVAAQVAAGFYLGRIDGRVTAATLKTEIVAQAKTLTPANAPSLMNTCLARMADANRAIHAAAPQSAPVPAKAQAGR